MFSRLKEIINKIKSLNTTVNKFQKDTVIQSLPSLTYVNRAKKLITERKLDEAERILQEALELPQKDALVYKYLGTIQDFKGKHNLAVENFQISADLNPNDKEIWRKLGFALLTVGKYENAEKSFENADKIQALNTDNFTGWGMSLMKQMRYNDAREKFIKAIQYNKYNYSALFLCSVMEMKLEMYDKAETRLAFLTRFRPNESNNFEYARLKAIKEDYGNAIYYAQKSLEFNSNMLPAYILLGQIYANNYDMENSLKQFQTAEEKELITDSLYLEWGKALLKFNKFEDAKIKFLDAKKLNEDNFGILECLALTNAHLKNYDEALSIIEKIPSSQITKQALGIINFEQGNIFEAVKIFKSLDDTPENNYYLAKCHENNITKAKEYYEAAILENPKFIQAYIDYVKFLVEKSEYQEAVRKLRKALKHDENNTDLLNLLFYANYILVKENICEYNIKETIAIAEKIENSKKFEYPDEKEELIRLLQGRN